MSSQKDVFHPLMIPELLKGSHEAGYIVPHSHSASHAKHADLVSALLQAPHTVQNILKNNALVKDQPMHS